MKRDHRRLFNWLAGLSLLTLIAVAIMLFSAGQTRELSFTGEKRYAIAFCGSGVDLIRYDAFDRTQTLPPLMLHQRYGFNWGTDVPVRLRNNVAVEYGEALGSFVSSQWFMHSRFQAKEWNVRRSDSATNTIFRGYVVVENALFVPTWFIILLLGFAPTVWIAYGTGGQLSNVQGRCAHCGYDLRATPDRCPECGTIPPKKETISN
jgi:hypothetical protein